MVQFEIVSDSKLAENPRPANEVAPWLLVQRGNSGPRSLWKSCALARVCRRRAFLLSRRFDLKTKFLYPPFTAMCSHVKSELKPALYTNLVECAPQIILHHLLGRTDDLCDLAIGETLPN